MAASLQRKQQQHKHMKSLSIQVLFYMLLKGCSKADAPSTPISDVPLMSEDFQTYTFIKTICLEVFRHMQFLKIIRLKV